MTDYTDLIAKLEAAPEGSREISDKVLLAVGWRKVPDPNGMLPWPKWYDPQGNYVCTAVVEGEEAKRPCPTTSLDAALTLVPEGWTTASDASAPDCGIDWELFEPGLYRNGARRIKGIGKTHALALCIAALKARAAVENEG